MSIAKILSISVFIRKRTTILSNAYCRRTYSLQLQYMRLICTECVLLSLILLWAVALLWNNFRVMAMYVYGVLSVFSISSIGSLMSLFLTLFIIIFRWYIVYGGHTVAIKLAGPIKPKWFFLQTHSSLKWEIFETSQSYHDENI